MSTLTPNLDLTKDDANDFYDIQRVNQNWEKIDQAWEQINSQIASIYQYIGEENTTIYQYISGQISAVNQSISAVYTEISNVYQHIYDKYNKVASNIDNIDATETALVGSKKADTRCWSEQCIYANTSTSANVALASVIVNKLRFQKYSVAIRLRSSNNILSSDAIKINILKNISGVYTSVASRLIKPNEFGSTTEYQNFYAPFEYTGIKATDNQFKIEVTLLT